MTTSTYRITGMTCEHCVAAVTEELQSLDGVTEVNVELVPGGTSMVTVSSEKPLTDDDVAAAVDEAGYALAGPRDLPLA
ncbi:heavy-metal-associated domain-containing protein [uncultured Aeromicrobium sp.]|uniref:heavy-metal-associated domain-containing protein n=1 Tax=uncultured Aeromicrobium sp. TaxID=337820 RepID=UPI0025EC82DC|nr:heavy-metal-associated domain-containing protein [uncultured Aeromicrobium sp.]